MLEPLCFGAGKVVAAEAWAARHGVDLADTTFYTDSYTDLPMLERVGRPVAVNPDPRLARTARRRGWPILRWSG
jgi:phosphoserine phosphatase